jgi:hypothetical protein
MLKAICIFAVTATNKKKTNPTSRGGGGGSRVWSPAARSCLCGCHAARHNARHDARSHSPASCSLEVPVSWRSPLPLPPTALSVVTLPLQPLVLLRSLIRVPQPPTLPAARRCAALATAYTPERRPVYFLEGSWANQFQPAINQICSAHRRACQPTHEQRKARRPYMTSARASQLQDLKPTGV